MRKVTERNESMDDIYCKNEDEKDDNIMLPCKTNQILI